MINVEDRDAQFPRRYQLNAVSGQADVFDLVPTFGTVTKAGTSVNRTLLLAMQGFIGQTTVFNADGSITETNPAGDTKITTFVSASVITEVFTSGAVSITKTTTFNSNGSITEVIS
jgi:hypothetical protein